MFIGRDILVYYLSDSAEKTGPIMRFPAENDVATYSGKFSHVEFRAN